MFRKIFYFFPTIILLLLFHIPSLNQNQEKLVVRVIDGDTIEVEGGDRIRLFGVDSPEKGEPFYEEAMSFLKEMIEGRRVIVERHPSCNKDKYGRFLRYVFIDEKLVNCELIRMGLAKVLAEDNPKYKCFQDAEEYAREKKLGIWSS